MASNREEKLQMRQRGAATRKIKEVDFGFSFGLNPFGTESGPSESTSQPTGVVAEPPPTNPDPENTESLRGNGLSASQGRLGVRNGPKEPSIFDIPTDEPPEERRASKRRKIESSDKAVEPSRQDSIDGTSSQLPQNGDTVSPSRPRKSIEHPPENDTRQPLEEISAATQSGQIISDHEARQPSDQQLDIDGGSGKGSPGQEPSQLEVPIPSRGANGKSRISASRTDDLLSGSAAPTSANSKRKRSAPGDRPSPESAGRPGSINGKRKRSQETAVHGNGEAQISERQRGKRPRGRPSTSRASPASQEPGKSNTTPSENVSESPQNHQSPDGSTAEAAVEAPQEASKPKPNEEQHSKQPPGKRRRGRLSTSARATPDVNNRPESRAPAESVSESRENRRSQEEYSMNGDSPTEGTTAGEPNMELNARVDGKHTKPNTISDHDRSPPQPQKRKTKTQKRARGRGRRPAQDVQDSQPEPEPELEADRPEHERRNEQEPTPPGPTTVPGRRGKGRPKKSDTAARPGDEQTSDQADGEEPALRAKQTRTRGETVPVTVHRLANIASLVGAADSGDSSAEEESADELSAQQKSKLPNRGGVNPADVLSQVCRETLEKTLTTLKSGISNETNPARRSEHVRKTKAVEAYGAELEGRLFDLSEILDSNFVLGAQAKKAKREMMDLRSRLYHIRKERQEVAVQMDAVRRQYTEEDDARKARSTINNSLHSLELAVDRNQNRPADGDGGAGDVVDGLEFNLRAMAQRVSSKAPGAHGGLLNQIKAFNAQLEAAAEKLEC